MANVPLPPRRPIDLGMDNDPMNQDDTTGAIEADPDKHDDAIRELIEKAYPRPYNDSSFDPNSHTDYPAYINGQTNAEGQPDEAYAHQRMVSPVNKAADANAGPELDMLTAKMASGTATRQEKMRFYDLTATGV